MKLFTVHGASDRSRVRPIEPAEVCMVADTPPSVEVGPAGGGVTGLAGVCWVVWYWQSTEAGSGCGRASVAGGSVGAGGGGVGGLAVVLTVWSPPPSVTISPTTPITSTTAATLPAIAYLRRALARCARRASWRSSLRFAASRRCSFVGTQTPVADYCDGGG